VLGIICYSVSTPSAVANVNLFTNQSAVSTVIIWCLHVSVTADV
jgi:hypothetical protein